MSAAALFLELKPLRETSFASAALTLSGFYFRSRFTHFSVFMSSSPPTGISLLISLLNLFHSRVSDASTWLRKENERDTRYRESAESPLWQNNLYTLTSPFIYLKASALTACWIALPVLISSADWKMTGLLACHTRFKAIWRVTTWVVSVIV